jgi:phage terminase Nu1 subunit (DNA packaging protein)
MQKKAAMKSSASVAEAARFFQVDQATVRRWICQGCPVVRKGRRGPGHGARLNLPVVAAWRGRANGPAGPTPEEILQRIAVALWECLESDRVDIRAGISREDAAAVLIMAFEACCKNFNVMFKFDQQPEPIRALMREL